MLLTVLSQLETKFLFAYLSVVIIFHELKPNYFVLCVWGRSRLIVLQTRGKFTQGARVVFGIAPFLSFFYLLRILVLALRVGGRLGQLSSVALVALRCKVCCSKRSQTKSGLKLRRLPRVTRGLLGMVKWWQVACYRRRQTKQNSTMRPHAIRTRDLD